MTSIEFVQREPGLFVVTYRVPAELAPDHQKPLIDEVVRAGANGPTGIVFSVGIDIREVDTRVPTFWLGVTSRRDTGLAAMAIVTSSVAVRVAATGFGLANRVRGVPIQVKTFGDVAQAATWVSQVLQESASAEPTGTARNG